MQDILQALQTDSGMYGAIGLVVGVLLLAAAWECRGHDPIPARPTRWLLLIPFALVGLGLTVGGGYVFKTRALDPKDEALASDPNRNKATLPPDAKSNIGLPQVLGSGGPPPDAKGAKGGGPKGGAPKGTTGKERPTGTGK